MVAVVQGLFIADKTETHCDWVVNCHGTAYHILSEGMLAKLTT